MKNKLNIILSIFLITSILISNSLTVFAIVDVDITIPKEDGKLMVTGGDKHMWGYEDVLIGHEIALIGEGFYPISSAIAIEVILIGEYIAHHIPQLSYSKYVGW